MTRAILVALLLLSLDGYASRSDSSSTSAKDPCLEPAAEIAGLQWDIQDGERKIAALKKQKKTYELTEGSAASISRVQRKIQDEESSVADLQDGLDRKQRAYDATCK